LPTKKTPAVASADFIPDLYLIFLVLQFLYAFVLLVFF